MGEVNIRNSRASLALDLLRATAAQAVCIGHAISIFGIAAWAQPPRVPYMQNVAVLLFFLLSGFLIAYTLETRSVNPGYGFGSYLVDRFARIYSAFVPALLVIALIDCAWTSITGETRSTFTLRNFIGSLFMLQDVTAPGWYNRLAYHSFGTAGQLWTLALEWHLYVFAGALFFIRRSFVMVPLALLACWVPINYAMELSRQDFGHGLTLLWLAGFLIFYAMPYLRRAPASGLALAGLIALALYFVIVPQGAEFDIASYGLLAVGFACIVGIADRMKAREGAAARVIRFAAAYSFTLYLVHNSIIKAAAKVFPDGGPILAATLAIFTANALSILIAVYTEMRHRELSAFLMRFLKALPSIPRLARDRLRSSGG